jgi:hypothetical protein
VTTIRSLGVFSCVFLTFRSRPAFFLIFPLLPALSLPSLSLLSPLAHSCSQTTYLRTRSIPFLEAADGVEAVALFEEHRPELVWLDQQMPNMDGVEASRLMREIEREEGEGRRSRIVRFLSFFPLPT